MSEEEKNEYAAYLEENDRGGSWAEDGIGLCVVIRDDFGVELTLEEAVEVRKAWDAIVAKRDNE